MSETALVRSGAKQRDYWWTVLATDPVAVPLVRFFAARGRPSPDQVTVAALVLGVAAGVSFSLATRPSLVAGALLFQLAFVFDCVDGKLARALSITSARGETLDKLADAGRRASASLGLTLWLWRAEGVPQRDVLWAVFYAVLAYLFLELSGAPKAQPRAVITGRWAAACAKRRLLPNPGMPDVQAVVFIIGPLSGFVVPALAVGIAMVSAGIVITTTRRLRAPRS